MTGRLRPLVLKPAPVAVIAVMVTCAVPVFVSVTLCVLALPTFTDPKLTLVGDAPSK